MEPTLLGLTADLLFLVHLAYIVFVSVGGFLAWRWLRVAWLHVPAVVWGVVVQFVSWMCPLTALENAVRRHAGEAGYEGGFIEHYVMPLVYPANLSPTMQIWLAAGMVLLNGVAYGGLLVRGGSRRARSCRE
jgi:hypothetical protein